MPTIDLRHHWRCCALCAVLLALTAGLAWPLKARAQQPALTPPLLVSDAITPGTPFALEVDPYGMVSLAWHQEGVLHVASPSLLPGKVFTSEGEIATNLAPMLSRDRLEWQAARDGTAFVQSLDLPQGARRSYELIAGARWALNPSAELVSAWADGTTLTYTLPAGAPQIRRLGGEVRNLQLSADAGYLVWEQTSADASLAGIYVLELMPDAMPLRIAADGSPLLADAQGGVLHVLYRVGDSLIYRNSANWEEDVIVLEEHKAASPLALSADTDGSAWLAWADGARIILQNSIDRTASQQVLTATGVVEHVTLAVGSRGQLHLAFSATGEEGTALYYLPGEHQPLQLAINGITAGEVYRAPHTVHAQTNLPATEILRISFRLEYTDASEQRIYQPAGTDADGRDGWSTLLGSELSTPVLARVCALATASDDRQAEACSGEFTLLPTDQVPVQLYYPADLNGMPIIYTLVDAELGGQQIDLYVQPLTCRERLVRCTNSDIHYLGRQTLGQPRAAGVYRQRLLIDWDSIASGSYYLIAAMAGTQPDLATTPGIVVQVAHEQPPQVSLLPFRSAITVGELLEVRTLITASAEPVSYVDFYLVREDQPGLAEHAVRFLGTSTLADKWRIQVPVNSTWLGTGWHIRAQAYDRAGLAGTTTSDATIDILTSGIPRLQFIGLPSEPISGIVAVRIGANAPLESSPALYVSNDDGGWTKLGEAIPSAEGWTFELDSHTLTNGAHQLWAAASSAEPSAYPARATLIVANQPGTAVLNTSLDQPLSDKVTLSTISPDSSPYRWIVSGTAGSWELPRPAANSIASSWLWDSRSLLDGPYTLTLVSGEPLQPLVTVQTPITVQNQALDIRLISPSGPAALAGTVAVCWESSEASEQVRLEYSPDDGASWLTIVSGEKPSGCYRWDSTRTPDSSLGRVRAVALAGLAESSATSGLLAVDNIAEQPLLRLLAPSTDTVTESGVRIAWRSWNPDACAVQVRLSYALEGSDQWKPIAQRLPANGEYIWDVAGRAPFTCTLKAEAVSDNGRVTTETHEGLHISPENPLSIRLFSPIAGRTLQNEVLVLWNVPALTPIQDSIDLYFSDDAGITWVPLAEGLRNTSNYRWLLSYLPPGENYRIRARVSTANNSAGTTSGTFIIGRSTELQVQLSDPPAAGLLRGITPITWRYEGRPPSERRVELALKSAQDDAWLVVAEAERDTGMLLVDTNALADGAYQLRLTVSAPDLAPLESILPVTINNQLNLAPITELHVPERLLPGQLVPISWRVCDPEGLPVAIRLRWRSDLSQEWVSLGEDLPSQGESWWQVPTDVPSGLLELSASDGVSESILQAATLHTWLPDALLVTAQNGARALTWELGSPAILAPGLTAVGQPVAVVLATTLPASIELTPRLVISGVVLPSNPPLLETQLPDQAVVWRGQHELTWQTDDPLGRSVGIRIDLSADGGHSWDTLENKAESQGSYMWDTTRHTNGTYLVRIRADNRGVFTQHISAPITLANPQRDRPAVALIEPDVRTWWGNRTLRWSSPQMPLAKVSLLYSEDGTTWQIIAGNLPDSGSYTFDTRALPNSAALWLRLIHTSELGMVADITDTPIAVANPESPNILVAVAPGLYPAALNITWQTSEQRNVSSRVRLYYAVEGSAVWVPLAEDLAASGSYSWDAGALACHRVTVKAVSSNDWGSAVALSDPVALPCQVRPGEANRTP